MWTLKKQLINQVVTQLATQMDFQLCYLRNVNYPFLNPYTACGENPWTKCPYYLSRAPLPPYIREAADENLKTIGQYPLLPISLRSLKAYYVNFVLGENNLLNVNQHGLRSKRSYLTQLLENYNTILNLVEEHLIRLMIRSDKVDDEILCDKLKQLVIGDKVGTWISNFVSDIIRTL